MPLLAELFAFVLPATYKDLAPTGRLSALLNQGEEAPHLLQQPVRFFPALRAFSPHQRPFSYRR